jgi:hypothetical protein
VLDLENLDQMAELRCQESDIPTHD